jgi:hypothetical protein
MENVSIDVAYLTGRDGRRVLAFISPGCPCRKTLYIVDFFGAGEVIRDIVVEETWRKGQHVYRCSHTGQLH